MRALTVWRPWDQALLFAGKNVENRGWPFPAWMLGDRIALHAGQTYQVGEWPWPGGFVPLSKELSPAQAVVGVATLAGWIGPMRNGARTWFGPRARMLELAHSPWFSREPDAYGWAFDDRIALPDPIPCRGRQGLWPLPEDVLRRVREQLAAIPQVSRPGGAS